MVAWSVHGGSMPMVARAAVLGKFFLHGAFFLVVKLTVLIRVELLKHFFLEFCFACLEGGLHSSFFLLVELTIFVSVKFGHDMLEVRVTAGRSRLGIRSRCRSSGCFLSHD